MLNKLLFKSVLFVCAGVMLFFASNDEVFSQDLGAEATVEENIPREQALVVKYVNADLGSVSEAFKETEPLNLELQIQDKAFPNGGGSVSSLEVRGVHNGDRIFFNFRWSDKTKNDSVIADDTFRDAVGLMFPLDIVKISPETPFSPRMGDRGKPVNIWHWKADWEREMSSKGGVEQMEDHYPDMFTDFDFNPHPLHFHEQEYQSVPLISGGRAAGNVLSQPDKGTTVEDLNAIGFSTLTTQEHQDVQGSGSWDNGGWNVTMYRSLITADNNDVQFIPGVETFFNVAVWNGEEGDRNGQKSISARWNPVKLETVKYLE
ncbi:MAG: hypothetical protein GY941_09350 [Planctomycetes bacterium]|nr:hypothetical protein [Planctomycetota bacterium]